MRYEDMPKGRNKDRCVRCGKRYNFADKALSKAKVPYDLLCLAEVTTSGYMTHGNVKLCDECMAELLMWLDRKTENCSEIPNNCECEPRKEQNFCGKCRYLYRDFKYGLSCYRLMDNEPCKYEERKDEPTISKMEQVEDEPMKTTDYCDICKRDMCEDCIADATNPYCVPSHYEINYEPKDEPLDKDINVRSKDEPKTQMKTQNSNLTFEKRTMRDCYNCKRYEAEGECIECHYEPKDEPQTEKGGCTNCAGKDLCKNAFTEISQYCGAYEPQNGYQTFNGTSVYVSRLEDEPQTDNGIGCSRCGGRYDCYDRDMPNAVYCNNYGKVTDYL